MYVTFNSAVLSAKDGDVKLDISALLGQDDVTDADTLHSAIVVEVAKWALQHGTAFNEVYPMYLHDGEIWEDDAPKVDAGPDSDTWTMEVAQFAWYVEVDETYNRDQAFAVLNNGHWQYFDFDDVAAQVCDDCRGEFEGDYDAFGRERMAEVEQDMPAHLEEYFDFEDYGRDQVNEYAQVTWNDRTFLYHQ